VIATVLAALKESQMEPEVVCVKVEMCVRQNVIVTRVQNLAKIR
jgi:hypothetical protein